MVDIQILKALGKHISILYVEDEETLRESLKRYLQKIFDDVTVATNGQEGVNLYERDQYDIVITDIEMPLLNGLDMAKRMKESNPNQEIIIISAYSNSTYFIDAIRLGISDYIIKPIDFMQINQVLHKSILHFNTYKENLNYKTDLQEMIRQRTNEALRLEKEKTDNFEMTLVSFASMVEERDNYTGGHSQRVADYSRMIAQEMKLTQEECDLVYRAGILHDIGKVTTPDAILLKPKKLTELEFKIIQEHVTNSYNILVRIPMYKEMADIIICHHERFDGKGYPNSLKSHEIPLLSHIMIIADSFDAMTTNRIYKSKKNISDAVEELIALSGEQFDPDVVKSAVKALSKIEIVDTINQLPHTQIEKERFAYFFRDQLTYSYNIEYLNFTLKQNIVEKEYLCVNILYLHNLNQFNIKNGWLEGDKLLRSVAECLRKHFPSALVFRVHGDDFVIMNKKHIEVNLEDIKCVDIPKEKHIKMSKHHIDLREETITNFKELEKLILIQSE